MVRAREAKIGTGRAAKPRAAAPQKSVSSLRTFVSAHWAVLACTLILALMALAMVRSLPYHTITTDETVHIPAGYANWTLRDFAPNNEHPPLAKLWATIPWLVLDPPLPRPPAAAPTPAKRTIDTGRYFWQDNAARMSVFLFWARVPMIAIATLLGVLIFVCGRALFGPRAGVFAVALFSLEPTILAHGWIVHTDIPASTAYLGCWAALAYYGARPSWRRALIVGGAVGAAVATKYNLLILLPIGVLALAVLWLLAPRRGGARWPIVGHGALIAGLILLVVNAVYFFGRQQLTQGDIDWIRTENPARGELVLQLMRALSLLVPPYYQLGAYTVLTHNAEGHPAGLHGEFSTQGWWYYFPVAFALKTTLPILGLTIAGIGWALWRLVRRRDWRFALILVPLAIFAASTMSSHINIGVRHFLPAFPFCFLLAGGLLDRLWDRFGLYGRTARRYAPVALFGPILAVALLGWHLAESARTFPNYLSYMNQLASPEPRYYYLSDSNIEWGQDNGALAEYLRARGETSVRAAIAIPTTLSYLGIEPIDLIRADGNTPRTRYIAIGASYLNGSVIDANLLSADPDMFAEYRDRQPEAIFGGSIYLFNAAALPDLPPLEQPLPAGAYQAKIVASQLPEQLRAGEKRTLRLHVTNTSTIPFPEARQNATQFQLRVGGRWLAPDAGSVVQDDARHPLIFPLLPGETGEYELVITAPSQPGNYTIEIDLVQEGVAWFGSRGGTPLRQAIRVIP